MNFFSAALPEAPFRHTTEEKFKTQQQPVISDLWLRKTRARISQSFVISAFSKSSVLSTLMHVRFWHSLISTHRITNQERGSPSIIKHFVSRIQFLSSYLLQNGKCVNTFLGSRAEEDLESISHQLDEFQVGSTVSLIFKGFKSLLSFAKVLS